MFGVFDSGSGGLTVLHALRKKMPEVGVIYFGDIANAPYGEKSQTELAALTKNGVQLLKERGVTHLLSACNSVSASVLAGAAGEMPFIEMSLPTAQYMKQYTGKKFLLIATTATILSGLYEKALQGIVNLTSLPIAELAGAIEFDHPESEVRKILDDAFALRKEETYDGIILGCTHYPLIRPLIEEKVREHFGDLIIVDPAYPVAEAAQVTATLLDMGAITFVVSKQSDAFERKVKALFPNQQYSIEVLE